MSDAGQFFEGEMYCAMNLLRQKLLTELDMCCYLLGYCQLYYARIEIKEIQCTLRQLGKMRRIEGKTGHFSSFSFFLARFPWTVCPCCVRLFVG